MHDLSEHIGTVLYILGGLAGITTALIGLLWRNLNAQFKEISGKASEFSDWLLAMEKEGGVVSRESFFQRCADNRGKCPAILGIENISQWRSRVLESGGVMTKSEHEVVCERITTRVLERMEDSIKKHNIWVGDQIKLIQKTMENDVLRELQGLRKDLESK